MGGLLALATAACSGQQGGGTSATPAAGESSSVAVESSPPARPAVLTVAPVEGTSSVRMDEPVTVAVDDGTLKDVTVSPAEGDDVEGEFDGDRTHWHSTTPLTPGTTYTVSASAVGADQAPVSTTATFTTLKPRSTAGVRLNIGDDQVVGVGMPIIIRFDRPVKNTAAVLRALQVSTTPQVEGAWHWMEGSSYVPANTQVWFRPKDYWPAGTKVSMTANLGGVELSPGVWGKRTYTSRFTVGDSVISTVDMKKHTLTMRRNGSVVRTIPITTGKSGPRWSTRNGVKVITEKAEQLRMESSTLGISDEADPDFYSQVEYWTMRLTWSGEFLHARPGSEWAFGKQNISHGCTGMSLSNAKWLFEHSRIGDVVEYTGSTRGLESGNGYTAWNVPYEKWAAGAASAAA